MCLIIYSPNAKMPEWDDYEYSCYVNPDGIGVMSERGVYRWLDTKNEHTATGLAWEHMQELSKAGIPFGVHMRWNTHGSNSLENTHPFELPYGSYLMHNGVIGATSQLANKADGKSDTAIYCEKYLSSIRDLKSSAALIGDHIGSSNKLLIMSEDKEFFIVNEEQGDWDGDLWFSNTYSLPYGNVLGNELKAVSKSGKNVTVRRQVSQSVKNATRMYAGTQGSVVSFSDHEDEDYDAWLNERRVHNHTADVFYLGDLTGEEADRVQAWVDLLPDEVYYQLQDWYGEAWDDWPCDVIYDYLNDMNEDEIAGGLVEAIG